MDVTKKYVDQLELVLFRFGMTEDEKLEPAIQRVLPNVLELLDRPETEIRSKVLLVLEHINTRLDALPNLQLPMDALVNLYVQAATTSQDLTKYVLMYIKRGSDRIDKVKKTDTSLLLMTGISKRPAIEKAIILHMFFSILEEFAKNTFSVDEIKIKCPFLIADKDKDLLLQMFLDVLLYSPRQIESQPKSPKGAEQSSQEDKSNKNPTQICPGLSKEAQSLVENIYPYTSTKDWNKIKLVIIRLLSQFSIVLPGNDILPHVIVGKCCGEDLIIRQSEALERRLVKLDMENNQLVLELANMFLGKKKKKLQDKQRSPVKCDIQIQILSYMSRSKKACNSGGKTVMVFLESLYGKDTTQLLQIAGMSFFMEVCKRATKKTMDKLGPIFLKSLIKFLNVLNKKKKKMIADKQQQKREQNTQQIISIMGQTSIPPGGKYPQSHSSISPMRNVRHNKLRGLTYNAIAQLGSAPGQSKLFNKNLKIFQLFFRALNDETEAGILQNVHEGIALLRYAYMDLKPSLSVQLQIMLQTYIDNPERRLRLAALQSMNGLYPFNDNNARYMCLRLVADPSPEVRNEAKKGLQVEFQNLKKSRAHMSDEEKKQALEKKRRKKRRGPEKPPVGLYPDFQSFMNFISIEIDRWRPVSTQGQTYITSPCHPSVLAEIIAFCQLILQDSAARSGCTDIKMYAAKLLEKRSDSQSTITTTTTTIVTTTTTTTTTTIASFISDEGRSLILYHNIIEYAFELQTVELHSVASASLLELIEARPDLFAPLYIKRLDWIIRFLLSTLPQTRSHVGRLVYMISRYLSNDAITKLLSQLELTINGSKPQLLVSSFSSSASIRAIVHGSILGIGVLVGECTRRFSSLSSNESLPSQDTLQNLTQILVDKIEAKEARSSPSLCAASCLSLGRIGLAGALPLRHDIEHSKKSSKSEQSNSQCKNSNPWKGMTKMKDNASNKDMHSKKLKVNPNSETAAPEQKLIEESNLKLCIDRLLILTRGERRKEARIVEEAIDALGKICIGDQRPAVIDHVLSGLFALSNITHQEIHFSIGNTLAAIGACEAIQIWETPIKSGIDSQNSTEEIQGDPNIMTRILDTTIFKYLTEGSKAQRAASCTWLLCIVKYAGNNNVVQKRLPEIQKSFTQALTSSNQFIQECASKGMALVYENGGEDMRDALISSLVNTFSVGKRKVTADTQVVLNERSGEFSTYKELCSVAKEMGQPDMIYKFLDLASHHSIWNSKLGAAFSLGSIFESNEDDELPSQLVPLIPKLFRYQYDPNKKIKETMKQMWETLVADPDKIVNQYFDTIMRDLMVSMTARTYRVRQSSNLATCDLLTSRQFDQVADYLENLWKTNFRTLDDVHDGVRDSAKMLAKTLSNMTVRLCDPVYTTPKDVSSALALTLPLFLKGINNDAKEVTAVSIATLVRVTKVSGKYIAPHLADVLGGLLEALSSQEPGVFSYMQFHTNDVEKLETARLTLSKMSPISEAISSCQMLIDAQSIEVVIHKLAELLRHGVGLPTLTACGSMVSQLANSNLKLSMAPHISPLMKTLTNGLLDRSATLRKNYATALSYCCQVATEKRIKKVVHSIRSMYTSTDNAENDIARLTGGIVTNEIFKHGGENAIKAARDLIPVAFVAYHDPNAEVAKIWRKAWEEVIPNTSNGCLAYSDEIIKEALELLKSPSYLLRKTSLQSLKKLAELVKTDISHHVSNLVKTLTHALPGRLWDGKELILEVLLSLFKKCKKNVPEKEGTEVLNILVRECGRWKSRVQYGRVCVRILGEMSEIINEVIIFEPSRDALEKILLSGHFEKDSVNGRESIEEKKNTQKKQDITVDNVLLANAYKTIGQVWPIPNSASMLTQVKHASWLLDCLLDALASGLGWNVRVSILNSLNKFCKKLYLGEKEMINNMQIKRFLDALLLSLMDRKYRVVRIAVLQTFVTLITRVKEAESKKTVTTETTTLSLLSKSLRTYIPQLTSMLQDMTGPNGWEKEPGVLRLQEQLMKLISVNKTS